MLQIERKTIENDEEYLRQISLPVDLSNDDYKEVIEKLEKACEEETLAMALASIQLGIPLRLVYLKKTNLEKLDEDYNEARVLINPVIIKKEGLTTYWEACASCLDYTGLVERPYKMEVEYYDIDKVKHHEIFEGFEATVLSHEMDHLDGILHIDIAKEVKWLTPEERKEFRKTHPYEIIRKDGEFISKKSNQNRI